MKKPLCAVIGASGFLGTGVLPELVSDFDLALTSMRPRGGKYISLDIRDGEALRAFIKQQQPDVVVVMAAYKDPDYCEEHPDETRRLNVAPVVTLCSALPEHVPLLFISTDYVFDGNNPPYSESSPRNPLSLYGRSKLEAEDRLMSRARSTILRVPLLMGWTDHPEHSGFFSHLMADLKRTDPLALDNVLKRYPVWTRDVGCAIRTLLINEQTGIFHYSTSQSLTRYKAALELGGLLGWPTEHLRPSDVVIPRKAQRPLDAQLATEKWDSMGYPPPNEFREVVLRFLQHFEMVPRIP